MSRVINFSPGPATLPEAVLRELMAIPRQSGWKQDPVAPEDHSLINVPFKLKDDALDDAFLKGAQARGMVQLKGHRSVGGMRASIYNAMSIEGVKALVQYMKEFEVQHG